MAKKRIDRTVNVEAGLVSFVEVKTGDKLECDVARHVPDYAKLPDHVKRLLLHGANAKFGDSAADPEKPAMEQIRGTYDAWAEGKWSSRGDGAGGGARVTDLAQAVFNVMSAGGQKNKDGSDLTLEQVIEAVSAWDDEKKSDYRAKPKIKAEIERIRAQKARERAAAAAKAAKAGGDEDVIEL